MSKWMIYILLLQVHLAAALSFYAVKIFDSTTKAHWEPVLASCLLEVVLVWIYLKGLSLSKGKNLVEIIRGAVGKWGAILILLPFVLFIFFHLILLARNQITDINITLLPQTPLWATTLVYVILLFYAASKGIAVIARMSVALFFLFMPFVLFSLLISYKNFDLLNAFPLWDPTMSFVTKPSYYVSMYAHTGFLFLGMLSLKKSVTMRKMWSVFALIAFFYIASVYVPLFIFGQETLILLEHPTLIATDTIDLEWVVFDWLPTFFIVSSSALSILEGAVSTWMFILLIRKLILPVQELWLLLIFGFAVYVLSLMIPNVHRLNHFDSVNTLFALYSIIIIPVVTVLSSLKQRRHPS
ncbi:spore germination protein [Paenibacillus radicis (ex Xue et al. 2023)]|uniref:Spore germination protein n=1 Tax=Paenibacillus radicis (ex Xue et al. 2023) TaxID=2972489 RepID=A0ABT1YT55_9BACL|nr:spore germination protein [Paenibacillus radicis (ex Xue et al. 2023)]MCR8635885.1 spore germination protein [Paenibacillus radicis (ex Xue et al. 2023)]